MKKKFIIGLLLVCVLFTATACKKRNNANNNENETPIENNPVEVQPQSNNTSNDLYSDDSKLVFQQGNTKYVFYYSGESITGYKTYTEYEDPDTAQGAYEFLKSQGNKNISVSNNYLVMEFGPEEYANLTTNDIKSAYSYMTEVTR